jgi:hypothetical protein
MELITLERREADAVVNPPLPSGLARFLHLASVVAEIGVSPSLGSPVGYEIDVDQNVYTRASVARRKEAVDALESSLPVT